MGVVSGFPFFKIETDPRKSWFTAGVRLLAPAVIIIGIAGLQCTYAQSKEEPGPSSGSGFVVSSRGHVLTNNHVVANCATVDVVTASGETAGGRVTARDARNDLALVSTSSPIPIAVARFRQTPIRSGDDVVALGFPYRGLLAEDVNVSVGIVSATAGLRNDTSQLQISAPVQPGNSGGPLLDEFGAVVGVVVAKLDALAVARVMGDIPQNINFAIKAEVAQSFMRSHGVEPRMSGDQSRRLSPADIVQSARGFVRLISCDPQKEQAERLAAARAEKERKELEQRREAERQIAAAREAEERRETERQAAARAKQEADEVERRRRAELWREFAASRSAPVGTKIYGEGPWCSIELLPPTARCYHDSFEDCMNFLSQVEERLCRPREWVEGSAPTGTKG